MEYPLADEYAIRKGKIALDAITVADVNKTEPKASRGNAPQAAKFAWERRLNITSEEWKHIAKLYTMPLLKHTDKHLHFKHITHRRIGTRNRFIASPTDVCRLCAMSSTPRKLVSSSVVSRDENHLRDHRCPQQLHSPPRKVTHTENEG